MVRSSARSFFSVHLQHPWQKSQQTQPEREKRMSERLGGGGRVGGAGGMWRAGARRATRAGILVVWASGGWIAGHIAWLDLGPRTRMSTSTSTSRQSSSSSNGDRSSSSGSSGSSPLR